MAETTPSVDDLRRGLESLPQELYDQILKATFTADLEPRDLRNLEAMRQNLKFLHISSSTRALYATTYYGSGAVFEFAQDHGAPRALKLWLRSLPVSHRDLLGQVHIVWDGSAIARWITVLGYERDEFCLDLAQSIKSCLPDVSPAVAAKVFLRADGKLYG